jgi:hypothetical protein
LAHFIDMGSHGFLPISVIDEASGYNEVFTPIGIIRVDPDSSGSFGALKYWALRPEGASSSVPHEFLNYARRDEDNEFTGENFFKDIIKLVQSGSEPAVIKHEEADHIKLEFQRTDDVEVLKISLKSDGDKSVSFSYNSTTNQAWVNFFGIDALWAQGSAVTSVNSLTTKGFVEGLVAAHDVWSDWVTPDLEDGWEGVDSPGLKPLAYRVTNKLIEIRGVVRKLAGTDYKVFTLPPSFWPETVLRYQVSGPVIGGGWYTLNIWPEGTPPPASSGGVYITSPEEYTLLHVNIIFGI